MTHLTVGCGFWAWNQDADYQRDDPVFGTWPQTKCLQIKRVVQLDQKSSKSSKITQNYNFLSTHQNHLFCKIYENCENCENPIQQGY